MAKRSKAKNAAPPKGGGLKRLWTSVRLAADTGLRSQQIAFAFGAYGVAGSLGALGIEAGRKGLSVVGVGGVRPLGFDGAFGRNLAFAFARLGPTFIKLGQILASRPDVVGEPVAEELKVLFDRVPAIAYREIRAILKKELGPKFRHLLKEVDKTPLASASISQTHRAVLADGTPVILKIQKPGVARTVQADLQILGALVPALDRLYPRAQVAQMFADFREATLREIDYRLEAENIRRFQANYRSLFSQSSVAIPRCYDELTTPRVLALEPMRGKKVAELKKGSTVARSAAELSLTAVLEQIFDHGFFHGDPHAGNLFYLEDEGRVGFIDLGLVGHLEPEDKQRFLKVVLAILKRDRDRLARSLFELGVPSPKTDFDRFNGAIQALLDDVKTKGVANLRLDEMIQSLLNIARENGVHIPNRYVMMMRSCLLIEGVARSLDPNLSLFQVATPVVARSLMKSYNPLSYLSRLWK